MPDIIEHNEEELRLGIACIDRNADNDLLYRETLVRSLVRSSQPIHMMLVIGSGESCERALAIDGFQTHRSGGTLSLDSPGARTTYERVMREEGRKIVHFLTDAGLSSVGFFGADRGILRQEKSGDITASRTDMFMGLNRSGVLSVLMCGGRDRDENIVDIHPTAACFSIQQKLLDSFPKQLGDIILLCINPSDTISELINNCAVTSWSDLLKTGLQLDPATSLFAGSMTTKFFVSQASELGQGKAMLVMP